MKKKRYAILGDIHGNWEALTAVLDDAKQQGVTDFACIGDIVGYNADPSLCLDKIRELKTTCVRGNHDHYCSYDERLDDFHPLAANVIDWTRKQLSAEQTKYLHDLKLQKMVSGFALVHSTLDLPEKWGYVFDTLEADAHFNYQMVSTCFYGHTHVPVVFEKDDKITRSTYTELKIELGKKYFINVGSVGQPRDGDPRSAYVIYDINERKVELRRIAYDIATTQKKIKENGLPDRLAKRLAEGK
ncbi:MAG: metallophosphoesterase family protein [Kiritimatiellae bacterium]|nr:metallophosphoesterase family protein [Kiritimatiellia bacterium]